MALPERQLKRWVSHEQIDHTKLNEVIEQFEELQRFVAENFGDDFQKRRRPDGVVQVLNSSGADLNQYDIIGLDGPLLDTSSATLNDLNNFKGFKGVTAVSPTHFGKWGVLQEGIKSGKIGLVRVSGLGMARVNVTNPNHLCAGITSGDPTHLTSTPIGVAQIKTTFVKAGTTYMYFTFGTTFAFKECGAA